MDYLYPQKYFNNESIHTVDWENFVVKKFHMEYVVRNLKI